MATASRKPSKSAQRQQALGVVTKTLRLRVKDKHAAFLRSQAIEVNQVWNFCQASSLKILERERRFCSGYDLDKLTSGATKEGLSLHSQTLQAISSEYCTRRKQFKRAKLRWRVSFGSRRSLGWIPFKSVAISYRNGQLHYQGRPISLWDSFGLKDYTLRSGSFCEDARGRWYVNLQVEAARRAAPTGQGAIAYDLGLKDVAVGSDGTRLEAQCFYRDLEEALAIAQRANKKDRVKTLHAKITNRRKDHLHKFTTAAVRQHAAIFVGDVSSTALTQTTMAKSVLDAGWGQLRSMLSYKSDHAGSIFGVINESYSTQTCSCCKQRTGPKGRADLHIRNWVCSACGAAHDRDVNAARNILARALEELEHSFSVAAEGKTWEPAMNKDCRCRPPVGVLEHAMQSAAGHGRLVAGILAV